MSKQTVLIIGAHWEAGSHILDGLRNSGKFNVLAGVRPASKSKPKVKALESLGIEIRVLDLQNSTIDELAEALTGISVVISSILDLPLQRRLADACKQARVNRLIPCDWGPACSRGIRTMFDDKLDVQDYIKEIGVGYTFIDAGWWMQMLLPYADPSKAHRPEVAEFSKYLFGTGEVKCAVTDVRDLGKFVARIILDDRTMNRYVFCWTEEVTQKEAFALAERVSGRKFNPEHLSADEVTRRTRDARNYFEAAAAQYNHSLWVRGDNTVENAKKKEYGGALDARELYPELTRVLRSLEDYAKTFYRKKH